MGLPMTCRYENSPIFVDKQSVLMSRTSLIEIVAKSSSLPTLDVHFDIVLDCLDMIDDYALIYLYSAYNRLDQRCDIGDLKRSKRRIL